MFISAVKKFTVAVLMNDYKYSSRKVSILYDYISEHCIKERKLVTFSIEGYYKESNWRTDLVKVIAF